MIKDKTFKPSPCYLTAIKTVESWRSQSQSQFLAVTYDGEYLCVARRVRGIYSFFYCCSAEDGFNVCTHEMKY